MLNKLFTEFCSDIFEKDVFLAYKSESKQEWSEMKADFLSKACAFEPSQSSTTRLRIDCILRDSLKRGTHSRKGSKLKHLNSISWSADKICISSELLKSIIKPSVDHVIEDIKNATSNEAHVEEIVVFGELVKLPMFTHGIVKEFSEKNITFYEDETHSALKGAINICLGLGQIEKKLTEYVHVLHNMQVHNPAIVAAIDFGTTYSGWAYSLRTNFELDRTKVSTKLWKSGSLQTEKTSTCILIGQDGKTAKAFGYKAEDEYQELVETGDHGKFYYFRRFKMSLNKKLGEKLDRDMTLEDVMNRSLPALDVFAMSIRFLKDDLLSGLPDKYLGTIWKDDIHWVLTVPAIWTDGSKQFMREAAIKAGIKRKRLSITLEPGAASMYCRSLPIEATKCTTGVNISSLSVGIQYMVLDAGGGTIDITVHEVESNNGVREVHAACGGGWGGTTIDEEFKKLLISLVTEDVYEKFKQDDTDDWLYIWRDFEVKKREISPTTDSKMRMRFPISLTEKYFEITGSKLPDDVKSSKYGNDIKIIKDKINISLELAKSWFTGSVDKTVQMVKSILSRNQTISAILMVGGFSESKVLQSAVRSEFKDIDVIIPDEASTCILKGALIFGHLPKVVSERVLKYTYGIESFEEFVFGQHPLKKLIQTDKGNVCQNIFSKHAEVDQRVKNGELQVWHKYSPQYKSQKQMSFPVYASERPNPMYTDVDCTLIGKLLIDLDDNDESLDQEILVAFTFSGTEIVVEAKDKKTGHQSFIALE